MASRLSAYLDANTSRFQEGMRAASRELTSFGNVAKTVLNVKIFETAFDRAARALRGLTIEQYRNIDATSEQATALGANLRNFQALVTLGKDAGVSQEDIGSALTKSQKAIVNNDNALKALGLTQASLLKLTPDEQFNKIATAISGVGNATERTAITLQIFGKGAGNLVNLFDGYKEKLEEARQFNDKFNVSLSKIDASKVEEANDTWGRVKTALTGLGNTIAVKTSPVVTALGQALLKSGIDGQTFGRAVDAAMSFAGHAVDGVRLGVLGMREVFLKISLSIDEMVENSSKKLFLVADAAQKLPLVGEKMKPVADGLANLWDRAHSGAQAARNSLSEINRETEDFKTSAEYIDEIQKDADARAAKNVAKPKLTAGDQDGVLTAFENQQKALERQKKLLKDIVGPQIELKQTLDDLDILYRSGAITAEQYADALDKVHLQILELDKTASGGFAAGMLKVKKELEDVGDLAENAVTDGFKSAEDALVDFATTGKLSFSNMVDGIVADLVRLQVRQGITGPLFSALSSGGGFFSSLFSGFSLPSFDVGTDYVPHDMIAQIHKGERIVPASQNNGNLGANVSLTIVNNAGAKVSQPQVKTSNGMTDIKLQIDEAVSGLLKDTGSRSSNALKDTYGLGPKLSGR